VSVANSTGAKPQVLRLHELSKEQLAELKRAVEKNGGRAFVGVHPYYSDDPEHTQRLRTLFAKMGKQGRPLILLEDSQKVLDTANKILEIHPDIRIYAVSTGLGDPSPLLPRKASDEKRWDALAKKLGRAGVTRAHVFGQLLDFSEKEAPIYCVGATLKELGKRLEKGSRRLPLYCSPKHWPPSAEYRMYVRRAKGKR